MRTVRTGIFFYIRNSEVGEKLFSECWKWAADLGHPHGEYSTLLWWCDASCESLKQEALFE